MEQPHCACTVYNTASEPARVDDLYPMYYIFFRNRETIIITMIIIIIIIQSSLVDRCVAQWTVLHIVSSNGSLVGGAFACRTVPGLVFQHW